MNCCYSYEDFHYFEFHIPILNTKPLYVNLQSVRAIART